MKLVKELGGLAFGTRLRLLTDKFMQDGVKVYTQQGVDFEPRWFTLFYLLSKKSPLSISEITAELGYTQPAVTQIANIMLKKGIIKVVKDKKDTRKKMLMISPKGELMLIKLKPIWKGFGEAVDEMFSSIGYDVLAVVEKIEEKLAEKDLHKRVIEKLEANKNGYSNNGVDIIPYNKEYKDYFRDLNYEWIQKYFTLEEEDKRVLNNPEEEILNKGGEIFFASDNGAIIGTAALIKHDDGSFELAKMAVTEKARGRQTGKKLAIAVIEKAKEIKAESIFLETNDGLAPAMNLYKSLGFVQKDFNHVSKYSRSTVKMELKLS